jgi:hypothetical protein
MIVTLTERAVDKSTYAVTLAFTDESGAGASPTELTWTLYDESGAVVNERKDVNETPGETVTILLQGADLAVGPAFAAPLFLQVEGKYNSSLGTGLPLELEHRIIVQGLAAE